MQKWEYKIISLVWDSTKRVFVWSDTGRRAGAVDTMQNRLNELGEEGWELAGVQNHYSVFQGTDHLAKDEYDEAIQEVSGNIVPTRTRFFLKRLHT